MFEGSKFEGCSSRRKWPWALTLLVVSGLLARSLIGLMGTDLGFKPENVLLLESNIGDSHYNTNALRVGYYRPLLQTLSGLPGIAAVGGLRYSPCTRGFGPRESKSRRICFRLRSSP